MEKGGHKSLDAYVRQHFFRLQNKLILSENTFREGSNLSTTHLPLKGAHARDTILDLQLIEKDDGAATGAVHELKAGWKPTGGMLASTRYNW